MNPPVQFFWKNVLHLVLASISELSSDKTKINSYLSNITGFLSIFRYLVLARWMDFPQIVIK
jgi:hypothetical protein